MMRSTANDSLLSFRIISERQLLIEMEKRVSNKNVRNKLKGTA